jgi:putative transposase
MSATSAIRRPRRSRTYWARMVAEHAASDLSASAFCSQRKLTLKTFMRWKRKLAAPAAPSSPGFIELPVPAGSEARATPGWELELDLGDGVRVRLRRA